MKYRSKLSIGFITVAITSTVLALGIAYRETREFTLGQFESKALAIAATTAAFIDGDLIPQIKTRADESGSAYQTIQQQLRDARDANSRRIPVKFIYLLRPISGESGQLEYVVDSARDPKELSHVGDPYTDLDEDELFNHRYEFYHEKRFIRDQWGSWLSGYAPVLDSHGNYVCTLGVDINSDLIIAELGKLISFGATALLSSVVIAVIASLILSKAVTASLRSLCATVEEVEKGNLQCRALSNTHDEMNELADAINDMIKGLLERDKLKMNFSRYVSPAVMNKILASDVELTGEKKELTLLFSDIRNFTKFSESLAAKDVVEYLNRYFTAMTSVIFRNGGTLDKFMGDGLMAIFGAPVHDPDQAKHAVTAALEMHEELAKLNLTLAQEGKAQIEMGIGINTGEAIVGNVGSKERSDYTAIGDAVNIAARLEEMTKVLGYKTLVSKACYEKTQSLFHYSLVTNSATPMEGEESHFFNGKLKLKGRSSTIEVYTVS